MLDDEAGLGALAASEDVRGAVLGDDCGVLEGGDGSIQAGHIVEVSLRSCQEPSAITACPPGECRAPSTKSGWPPKPEYTRPPMWLARPGREGRPSAPC